MKLNEVIAKYGNQEVDESKIKEVFGVKESKVWKPSKGECYNYFMESGVGFTQMNMDVEDSPRWKFGNCFKTQKEAEFAREKQIFLTKFERYLRENEDEPVDWGDGDQDKWALFMDYDVNKVFINSWCVTRYQGTIFTTNKYALEKFIKDNESDIKKYMFGVE